MPAPTSRRSSASAALGFFAASAALIALAPSTPLVGMIAGLSALIGLACILDSVGIDLSSGPSHRPSWHWSTPHFHTRMRRRPVATHHATSSYTTRTTHPTNMGGHTDYSQPARPRAYMPSGGMSVPGGSALRTTTGPAATVRRPFRVTKHH